MINMFSQWYVFAILFFFFLLFLEADMFYTWRVSGHPLCLYTSSIFVHPHMSPIVLCASVCSQRLLHVVGSCKEPLTC